MFRALLFISCFLSLVSRAQIQFSEKQVNLGTIPEAFEIKGDLVLKNISTKKIFLLRADAEKGVKVYTSRKTLMPNDTCLLLISFNPEASGKFNKKIDLVSSDRERPYELFLSGNLTKVKTDDKTACYYFGTRKNNAPPLKEILPEEKNQVESRDNRNRIPDQSVPSYPAPSDAVKEDQKKKEDNSTGLSASEYKPNNILFLVDISGSMKDSLKLPLMKSALHVLVDAVRSIDLITFVTYADTVRVIAEAIKGSEKKMLNDIVEGLRAHGLTKGNKAILFSQDLAQKHFINGGNNQILLATDGKFRFNEKDLSKWKEAQGTKKIILSTVAFGDDKVALRNLEDIALDCEGSFIRIKSKNGSRSKLLDEIKERSKIH